MNVISQCLYYRRPLEADGLMEFLRRRAVPGVEEVVGGVYRRSLALPGGAGVVELAPEDGFVRARFWLEDEGDVEIAVRRVRGLLDLDTDPAEIADALGRDPLIGPLVTGSPGRRVPGHVDPHELAVRAVLGQQVSLGTAAALAARLARDYGAKLARPRGGVTRLFPSAARFAAVDPERLPLPGTRRRALLALTRALASGELRLDGEADRRETRRRLLALPGIGAWTTEYIAMRALGDRDAFLAADLGVRRAFARLGLADDARSVAEVAERWRPYRAYAMVHLWADWARRQDQGRLRASARTMAGRRRLAIPYDPPDVTAPVVVILAAGQGTRMRSATPKLLHPLCGRPMIEWPVAAAKAAGAGKIVVVDSAERPLEAALDGTVELAVQSEPRGTADAVRAAASYFDQDAPVVVINGDVPLINAETLRGLVQAHEHQGAGATMATAVLDDPSGYGRVVRAPDGTVERVVETKAPGDATELELHIREVNTGIFAFEAAALLSALDEVRGDNVQGELYLPDVLPIIRAHERSVLAHEISDPSETLGINDRSALAQVRAIAQRRIHERHMFTGVTIVDPAATVIDADVEIGADTVIAPFTSVLGTSRLGTGCTIGPHATLIDTAVHDGATIVHSYLKEAEVGEQASVGPFTYLRPGAVLRSRAKAGTFVEIKNSDVGAGSKVPHLSYIGDADIGEGTNLGASTITANYDGYRKHRTKIGARVKTSVDTTLIAPVSVGDDAYTAAGSVITDDVPPGALGVARARQSNVEGYAQRRREREANPPKEGEKA